MQLGIILWKLPNFSMQTRNSFFAFDANSDVKLFQKLPVSAHFLGFFAIWGKLGGFRWYSQFCVKTRVLWSFLGPYFLRIPAVFETFFSVSTLRFESSIED